MLARSRTLHLAENTLASPLLVPSVSSKGFPIDDGVSEASRAADFASSDLTEGLLISAYDIHHGHLLECEKLMSDDHGSTMYGTPTLLVIDSGGYELADDFESGEVQRGDREIRPFGVAEYQEVLARLPKDRDLLAVSFDFPAAERGDYAEQRSRAQQLLASHAEFKSDFLLKPEPGSRFLDWQRLVPEAANLRAFDVIGVTEKELGKSVVDRLVTLARIRGVMDEAGVTAPIHVFGALDPLISPLYFMAGGEIFDGLSWVRYAYFNGIAVHQDAVSVLQGHVDDDPQRRDARRHLSNLAELKRVKHRLERWAHEPDRFDLLGPHHQELREVYEILVAHLARKG